MKMEIHEVEKYQQPIVDEIEMAPRMSIVDDRDEDEEYENLLLVKRISTFRWKKSASTVFLVLCLSAILISVSFWAGRNSINLEQNEKQGENCGEESGEFGISGVESNSNLRNGDVVTIRSLGTGKYISALPESQGFGLDQEGIAQDWEKFVLVSSSDGSFGLKSYHSRYMRAAEGDDGWMIDQTSTEIGSWEKFMFYQLTSGFYQVKTHHTKYMRANAAGTTVFQGTWGDDYELWVVTKVNIIEHDWKAYMHGINLGGWLVLENWITKPLMEGTNDEWSLIQHKGGPYNGNAVDLMYNHWDHFFTEDDLQELQNFGFTHIRIPIGWWIVDYNAADGFVDGGWTFLDRMIGWIGDRGMYVVLDLHAMPGAQTSYQSFTGKSESQPWFLLDENNLARGEVIIMKLANKIKEYETHQNPNRRNVIMGIELVNEPQEDQWDIVSEFYTRMVPKIRAVLEADRYAILLSIMNSPREVASYIKNQTEIDNWENVILDRHVYHAYGDDDGAYPWTRSTDSCKTCCRDPTTFEMVKEYNIDTLIGEWALNTASGNPDNAKAGDFLNEYFWNQISHWHFVSAAGNPEADNSHSRGHFFWTAKIVDDSSDYYINFDMLKLIRWGIVGNHLWKFDTSRLCPMHDLTWCPLFDPETVRWNEQCIWQTPVN